MKTTSFRACDIDRVWYLLDAEGEVLGRLAARVSHLLRGKHRPEYTPHSDCGDHVVIINAARVRVTGKKRTDKIYYRHSGYPGGLKQVPFERMHERFPTRAVELAVKGMLPRNPLGRKMLSKLKVYAGPEHRHQAQKLVPLEVSGGNVAGVGKALAAAGAPATPSA